MEEYKIIPVGRAKNIIGERFGRLVVVARTENTNNDVWWLCKCDCGNITEVRKSKLSSGNTKSCGCLARELTSERRSNSGLDLTGKRFDRLVAIKPTGEKTPEGRVWLCKCDCGGSIETTARNLNGGRTTSCGCKQREQVTKLGLSNVGKKQPGI